MNSLLIIVLISLSVALVICVQATQATTRENLSSGFQTKRVLNQSLRLNRLARNGNFPRSKCRYDSSKKADNKVADETARMRRLVCAFIVTNHLRQVFAVAVQLLSMNALKTREI